MASKEISIHPAVQNGERQWLKVLVTGGLCIVGVGFATTYWIRRRRQSEKPQRRFRIVYADNTDTPFLHPSPLDEVTDSEVSLHPYVHEILALKQSVEHSLSSMPVPVASDTPWKWIDSKKSLRDVINELNELKVLAMDTEFHRQRSYHGFTCLLQIFTGTCIYLIDAIALHDDLHLLNDVLSNPSIRKVLHGCHNDTIWLQKDFKAYLVNVFDTEKACQVLKKAKSNLAHLLEVYFSISTDKSMQQADWRRRPLTADQVAYAKLDVQYLLHLEGILKQELLKQEQSLSTAIQKSHDMCLSLYQKPTAKEAATHAALHIIRRYFETAGKSLRLEDYDQAQERPYMSCVYRLCMWRDEVARAEDDSPEFVFKSKVISLLSRELPETAVEILDLVRETALYDFSESVEAPSCWNPSRVFVDRILDVVQIIEDVRSGRFVWNEGPAFLDSSKKRHKLKNKSTLASRNKTVEIFSAKSKVYGNCQMLSLDGELLCYCERRNLEWYVRKKIAKHRIADEANGSHDFYVQSRVNCCVACGEEGHYLRYKVVPACYRKNFPIPLKSHRSHDVVLLCIDCHHIAQTAADRLKRILAKEYGIPLALPRETDGKSDAIHPTKVRAAALALENSRDQIPLQRQKELEKTIHLYFGKDPLQHGSVSAEDLKLALLVGMSKRARNKTIRQQENGSGMEVTLSRVMKNGVDSGELLHGEMVVAKAMENGGEAELYSITRRFRGVFVDAVRPKYLPKKWDIDHFAPRAFGEHSVFFESG